MDPTSCPHLNWSFVSQCPSEGRLLSPFPPLFSSLNTCSKTLLWVMFTVTCYQEAGKVRHGIRYAGRFPQRCRGCNSALLSERAPQVGRQHRLHVSFPLVP